jgi:hypothetical protein
MPTTRPVAARQAGSPCLAEDPADDVLANRLAAPVFRCTRLTDLPTALTELIDDLCMAMRLAKVFWMNGKTANGKADNTNGLAAAGRFGEEWTEKSSTAMHYNHAIAYPLTALPKPI